MFALRLVCLCVCVFQFQSLDQYGDYVRFTHTHTLVGPLGENIRLCVPSNVSVPNKLASTNSCDHRGHGGRGGGGCHLLAMNLFGQKCFSWLQSELVLANEYRVTVKDNYWQWYCLSWNLELNDYGQCLLPRCASDHHHHHHYTANYNVSNVFY